MKSALDAASAAGLYLPAEAAKYLADAGIGLYGKAGTWYGPGPAQEAAGSVGGSLTAGALSGVMNYLQYEDVPLAMANSIMTGLGYAVGGPLGGAIGAFAGTLFSPNDPEVQTVVPHAEINMSTPLQNNLGWGFNGTEFSSDNYGSWGGLYAKGDLSYKDNPEQNFGTVMEQLTKDSPDVMRAMNDINRWDSGFYTNYFTGNGALAGSKVNPYTGQPEPLAALQVYVRQEDPMGDFMKYRYKDGMSYQDAINKVISDRWAAIQKSGWSAFNNVQDPYSFMNLPSNTWQTNPSGPSITYTPGGNWLQGNADKLPSINLNEVAPQLIEYLSQTSYADTAQAVASMNEGNSAYQGLSEAELAYLQSNPELMKALYG